MKKIFLFLGCFIVVLSFVLCHGVSVIDYAQKTGKLKYVQSLKYGATTSTVTLFLEKNRGYMMNDQQGNYVDMITLRKNEKCKISDDSFAVIYKFRGVVENVIVFSVENVFLSMDAKRTNKEQGSVFVRTY